MTCAHQRPCGSRRDLGPGVQAAGEASWIGLAGGAGDGVDVWADVGRCAGLGAERTPRAASDRSAVLLFLEGQVYKRSPGGGLLTICQGELRSLEYEGRYLAATRRD